MRGVALFMVAPSVVVSRKPIGHLADFKDKKIRIFASQLQRVAMARLGAEPADCAGDDPAVNAIKATVKIKGLGFLGIDGSLWSCG